MTLPDAPGFAADFSTLTRASLNVEQDFLKDGKFVADAVLVVTFDRVVALDGAQVNTFLLGISNTYAR